MIEKTEIALSKGRILLMLIASMVFIAISLKLLSASSTAYIQQHYNPALINIVSVAAILLFGLGGIYYGKKIIDKKPGLIVDDTGITDNTSAVSAGLILWEDIEGADTIEIRRQVLIMVYVKNPEKYIDRQKGVVRKRLMSANNKMYGTPISITANTLKISTKELLHIIEKGFNEKNQQDNTAGI